MAAITRRSGSKVIWVLQFFATDLHDAFLEVKNSGRRIVIECTPGVGLLPELRILPSDSVIIKKRYSAFFGTDLDAILDRLACRTIIIAGVNSHACVGTTVVDAYQRDYDVWLATDCIDSYDEEHHAVRLRYMAGKMGIAMTNEEIEVGFRAAQSTPPGL